MEGAFNLRTNVKGVLKSTPNFSTVHTPGGPLRPDGPAGPWNPGAPGIPRSPVAPV